MVRLTQGSFLRIRNRNIALRQARGDLIAFAAHDDLLFADHLERLCREIERRRVDWIYSRPLWISTDGFIVPFCTNLEIADELEFFLNVGNSIPASCILHRQSCFDVSGYWPEDVSSAADWHLWQRIIVDGGRTRHAYLSVPTTLHFSASWRKSRYADSLQARTLVRFAEQAAWWPVALKMSTSEERPLQAEAWAAMAGGETAWCDDVRRGVEVVVDRLAWDTVLHALPTVGKRHSKTERSNGLARARQKLRSLWARGDLPIR